MESRLAALRPVAALVLIVLSACAAERQPLYNAPALWRVETGGGEIWLFPTLHFLPQDGKPRLVNSAYRARRLPSPVANQRWYWGPVRHALRGAEVLVVETSDTHRASELREIIEQVDDGAGPVSLRQTVGPEQWALVADALAQRGLSGESIEAFSAEQVLLLLYLIPTSSNLRLDPGVDRLLIRHAEIQRLDILALETTTARVAQVLEQFRRLDGDRQWRLIASFARATGDDEATIDSSFREWEVGNLEPMADSLDRMAEHFPELYEVIFHIRNRLWVDQILAYQEHHPNLFVAVGAGHFAGPNNLIDLFEERGLAVERVQ